MKRQIKENKKTFTYSCRPSIRKKAVTKAKRSGWSLSEVIDLLLERYADDKHFALPKKIVVVFGNEEISLGS
jgi:hypothetical protein